jgi:hypothetical protein
MDDCLLDGKMMTEYIGGSHKSLLMMAQNKGS